MTARAVLGGVTLATLLAACGDDQATDPDPSARMAEVAGDYAAEGDQGTLMRTANGQTVDQLANGASVTITLSADGLTSGRLFVPGAEEDGSDFEADLAGTWSLRNETVEFSHEADTFIRDMSFEVEDGQLLGDEVFPDERIQIMLQKR